MDTSFDWRELLKHPGNDHLVQVYQDPAFLVEAVTGYVCAGLQKGEAALIIARPDHRQLFAQALGRAGLSASPGLRMLDADDMLAAFMVDGMPEWTAFQRECGRAIGELQLHYPAVRAYGEMVDILWQLGRRHAAIKLEDFWNQLARVQKFSLLCAYAMDPLAAGSYGGGLESVCRCHTHLIPARDYGRFNDAVLEAAHGILDQPLAQMLLNLAASNRPQTAMPLGQATLIWLKQNMPRTADRVLDAVRARLAAAPA